MSRVRAQYVESYRYIRIMMRGGFELPPVVASWDSQFRPFMFALVSYDQRKVDHTGWCNILRMYQWWQRRDSVSPNWDMPF